MKFIHLIPALVFLHLMAPQAHAQAVVEYTGLMSQLTAAAPKVEKGVENTANAALQKLAQVEEVSFSSPPTERKPAAATTTKSSDETKSKSEAKAADVTKAASEAARATAESSTQ